MPEDKRTVVEIKTWLVEQLQLPRRANSEPIDSIINKILTNWRVNKCRIGLVSLSVQLPPEVAEKLAKMAKGTTKQSVIRQLIEDNYLELIREKNEQLAKQREERHRLKIEKAKAHSKAFFDRKLASQMPTKFDVPDDFKTSIAKIYHILFADELKKHNSNDELPTAAESKENGNSASKTPGE